MFFCLYESRLFFYKLPNRINLKFRHGWTNCCIESYLTDTAIMSRAYKYPSYYLEIY